MKITFEQFKKSVEILESDAMYELVAKKLDESVNRIYITNIEVSDGSVIVNVEISYCSCCRPESSSVSIIEEEFNELINK